MELNNHFSDRHAYSRYTCVTAGAIEKLQQDYLAGRDLGRSIPGMDETRATIIVAESLQADRLWEMLPQILMESSPQPPKEPMNDWSRATMAELFFDLVDMARELEDKRQARDYWALGWAMLEEACKSPTLSPLLWYEGIYFDVGHELRARGEREAVDFFKRALAHNLRHSDGENASTHLADLAETYLWIEDLDTGLRILTALLRNDPGDIWTYNAMAVTFDEFGLTQVGAEATRRALELVEATGDPEDLQGQLEGCLERMGESKQQGREAEVDETVLAGLRAALTLDFDRGEHRPIAELCHELVPDLDRVPVKHLPEKPTLPPPGERAGQRGNSPPRRKPHRNDPCWCGSGKKYKHCHMRADRRTDR
jgi:tetratricopeptide (TPR) repeat protein